MMTNVSKKAWNYSYYFLQCRRPSVPYQLVFVALFWGLALVTLGFVILFFVTSLQEIRILLRVLL